MQISAPLNSEPVPCLQQIEVATFFQLPSFQIIGLPGQEVAEARERVRAAIEASGLEFPRRRVVLNLSPASIRKRGTGLDLSMALAVLAIGNSKELALGAWGELGLDGTIKPVGQLTRALYASWKGHLKFLLLSWEECPVALQILDTIRESGELQGEPPVLVPVRTLLEAWKKVEGGVSTLLATQASFLVNQDCVKILKVGTSKKLENQTDLLLPLSASLERIVGVAISGRHHTLLLGPKGTGKSHAIEWFIALKPPLSSKERLRQDLIIDLENYKGRSHIETQAETEARSVRRVSSQVRPGTLIGSATSTMIRPGAFSLAHGGLLIADEFPEWHRDSREALREPLERQKVTLSRAQGSIELPAQFQMAATGNLCPCGGWPSQLPFPYDWVGDKQSLKCKCSDTARKAYISRLSGPILDRIDLVALVSHAPKMGRIKNQGISQLDILKQKVFDLKNKFVKVLGKPPGDLSGAETEELLQKSSRAESFLKVTQCSSLRSRHKIVRLAYSFAFWDGLEEPLAAHFLEAACYRAERFTSMMD
jgi:magnesium chelatase family protein